MILYFAIMALMAWGLLIAGFVHINRRSDAMDPRTLGRPGPRPKAVPPFPFGPISDLIRDAERQAEEDFYAQFPEERPTPDTGSEPGGYAMDSSPNGIIVSNGVMTPNEWRERYQGRTPAIISLGEDTTYRELTARNPPKMADVGTVDKPYQRYIEGIGIITADSEHKLERACEVVLIQKFRESEREMRWFDAMISNARKTGLRMDLSETREKRRDAWENCKVYLDLLQELNL